MSTICQVYSLYAGELWLGRRDDGGLRSVAIDVSPWLADLDPSGTFMLAVSRPGEDDSPYNPVIEFDGQKIIWTPDDVDTAIAGTGTAQLRYYVGTNKIKSKEFKTVIAAAPYTMMTPPSAIEPFVERIEQAAVDATAASASAAASAATATEHAETAETKATEASASAAQADASADAASASATSAAESATAAARSATAASNAAADATESEQIAAAAANAATAASGTASTKAAEAADSAQRATNQATIATGAARSASESAGDAEQAAETATSKATEASASATQADASADAASASATSASGFATAAGQSATAAANAQTAAQNAQTAAQNAQTGAENAQTGAENAQTGAEIAQTAAEQAAAGVTASVEQIETNRQDISSIKADLLQKANIDGAYSDLTAGNAEQLVSTVYEEDSVPYIFRTAGGSMDIGDREEDTLVGGTVCWNQLISIKSSDASTTIDGITIVDNRDGTYTVSGTASARVIFSVTPTSSSQWKANHKYVLLGCPSGGTSATYALAMRGQGGDTADYGDGAIWNPGTALYKGVVIYVQSGTALATAITFKPVIFDLTAMFGSAVADYVYGLEQASAGAGVAWFKKLFPADYYPYDVGTLKSVEGVGSHDMVGFNAWDEEWEVGRYNPSTGIKETFTTTIRSKNYIPIVPNTSYYCYIGSTTIGHVNFCYYDANKNFISFASGTTNPKTTPSNAYYMTFYVDSVYGTTYKNDICINLSWDGERDGEYEPYVKRSYPLDLSLTLRGIPKLDSANNLYYDGDTYESDGTVTRRYGVVDLGTLAYNKSQSGLFVTSLGSSLNVKPASSSSLPANLVSSMYTVVSSNSITGPDGQNPSPDRVIALNIGNLLCINNLSYTDTTAFKTAMSGVYLLYEFATPTTETAEPYQNPQIVDDFGTEEYVTTSIVPVGHVTKYQPNLRAKLEMSPDSPDGDGDYIVRQANGENSYIALASTATIQDILARLTALEGNTNEG